MLRNRFIGFSLPTYGSLAKLYILLQSELIESSSDSFLGTAKNLVQDEVCVQACSRPRGVRLSGRSSLYVFNFTCLIQTDHVTEFLFLAQTPSPRSSSAAPRPRPG